MDFAMTDVFEPELLPPEPVPADVAALTTSTAAYLVMCSPLAANLTSLQALNFAAIVADTFSSGPLERSSPERVL